MTDISIEDLWSGAHRQTPLDAAQGLVGGGNEVVERAEGGRVRWQQEQAEALADLSQDGQEVVVARGGRGGRGNTSFATKQHRAPKRATSGAAGQRLRLELELKTVSPSLLSPSLLSPSLLSPSLLSRPNSTHLN